MIVERSPVRTEGNLSYSTVIGRICSVHVARKTASEKRMEQSRIEFHLVLMASAFHTDASERFLPFFCSSLVGRVKVQ